MCRRVQPLAQLEVPLFAMLPVEIVSAGNWIKSIGTDAASIVGEP